MDIIEPPFVEEIRIKYRTRQSNVFLLTGNVKDLFVGYDGSFLDLSSYLEKQVINNPNRVRYPAITIRYDLADGIAFPNSSEEEEVKSHFSDIDKFDKYLRESQRNPLLALKMLREVFESRFKRLSPNGENYYVRYSLIIEDVEMITPQATVNYLHQQDRENLAFLLNWLDGSELRGSSNVVFMLSEGLSEVNTKLVSLPSVTPLSIKRPPREEREQFIELLLKDKPRGKLLGSMSLDQFASLTAGLRLREIQKITQEAEGRDSPINPQVVLERTKELIEQECAGLIEFILPSHTLEDVVGQKRLVEHLGLIRKDIIAGRKDSIPSGILVPGPNGSGKSFIFEAFAGSCGWIPLKFKNLRGSLVGETERNFEKVRSVLEALGHVVILVDEGDAELGGRGEFTHDVDRRLFAGVIRMMADPRNLGRLLFIIITCRPDKLEPDVKAPHRCSERLPVFDPGTKEEREEFLKSAFKRVGVDYSGFSEVLLTSINERTKHFSAADYRNATRLIKRTMEHRGEGKDVSRVVMEAIDDYLPPNINPERKLQELLAFLECSSRRLLPEKFKDLKREAVLSEVEELKGRITR